MWFFWPEVVFFRLEQYHSKKFHVSLVQPFTVHYSCLGPLHLLIAFFMKTILILVCYVSCVRASDCNSTEISFLSNTNDNSLHACLDDSNTTPDTRNNCLILAGVPLSTQCASCLAQVPSAADECASLCDSRRLTMSDCITCHVQALTDASIGCIGVVDLIAATTSAPATTSTKVCEGFKSSILSVLFFVALV